MNKRDTPNNTGSIYERVNAAAERIIQERRAQPNTWWKNRRLWVNHETWRSDTEADAFEHILESCPRQPGDPFTRMEQEARRHLRRTVVHAVLKEMHDTPPRRRRRKKAHIALQQPKANGSKRS